MSKMDIRLAGTGGQGLITGTIILAEAGIFEEKFVAQSQSYGPEARGGMCKGEVIISDNKIGFTSGWVWPRCSSRAISCCSNWW